jgi:hypothetical protein
MEKPIMIPAAAFFDPLFQNNAKGANCAIITKDKANGNQCVF